MVDLVTKSQQRKEEIIRNRIDRLYCVTRLLHGEEIVATRWSYNCDTWFFSCYAKRDGAYAWSEWECTGKTMRLSSFKKILSSISATIRRSIEKLDSGEVYFT